MGYWFWWANLCRTINEKEEMMGKLDKATERAFENEIGEAYEDLKFARNRLVKRYMQKVEDDMEVKRDEFARLLLSARDKGMSVAAIGRGMGTSSRNTIYQYFERAEQRGIMGTYDMLEQVRGESK